MKKNVEIEAVWLDIFDHPRELQIKNMHNEPPTLIQLFAFFWPALIPLLVGIIVFSF